jgi:hypothetical protein
VRDSVVATETSAIFFVLMMAAPPSSTTLRLPAKATTSSESLSVSVRFVADWKRSSDWTSVSLRPHTPPRELM